ncbi:MAG: hypothetical protein JWQ87_3893 [Candidatus Sulfotelmatobacter sp.]|nr:hypothetical protein [Candidatus Sulfotelmatobacter sp.]
MAAQGIVAINGPITDDALLVGEPEPDIPARNPRRIALVSEAQFKRSAEPVL